MNYLAHLFLSAGDAESLIGNLAGDFVKGRIDPSLPQGVAEGIRQHRRIDAFTDAHPAVAEFRRVLIPEYGHYARVIADMFFDHFLASGFPRFTPESLDEFVDRVHATIDTRVELLPRRLRVVYPILRDERWLASYASVGGIAGALSGISRRLSRQPKLAPAVRYLEDEATRADLEGLFARFFAEVMQLSSRP